MMPYGNFAQLGSLSGRPMPYPVMGRPSPFPMPQGPTNFGGMGDGGPRPVSDPRMTGPVPFTPPAATPPSPMPNPDGGTFGTPAQPQFQQPPAQMPPNMGFGGGFGGWGGNQGMPTSHMMPPFSSGRMMPLQSLMGY